MKNSLHPEAAGDLREAAEFYRECAGTALSQSLLEEFERSVGVLLQHPGLGALWRHGKRRYPMKRFPYSLSSCGERGFVPIARADSFFVR